MPDYGRLVGLAEAIAATLNAAQPVQPESPEEPSEPLPSPFGLPFTALRKVLPLVDLKKLSDLLSVSIIPVGADETRVGGLQSAVVTGDYEVDILVQQRLGQGDDAEQFVPPRLQLMEEIRDYLKRSGIALTGCKAALMTVDAAPSYSLAALLDSRCFVGAQTLVFKLI